MGEGSKFFEQGGDTGGIKEGSGNSPEDIEKLAEYYRRTEKVPSPAVAAKIAELRKIEKYAHMPEDALRAYASTLVNAEGEKSMELGDPTVIGEHADKKRKTWRTKTH